LCGDCGKARKNLWREALRFLRAAKRVAMWQTSAHTCASHIPHLLNKDISRHEFPGKLSGGDEGAASSENAGHGLEHDGVVRKLISLGKANGVGDSSYDAQTAVKLSPEWKRENVRVVVFVQDSRSRGIYAATSTTC
jgi:hypothetical protein